jgi:hypothetical protein
MKLFAGLAGFSPFGVRSITNVVTILMIDHTVLWDVTPYSVVDRYHRSGGTGFLHRQSRKVTV